MMILGMWCSLVRVEFRVRGWIDALDDEDASDLLDVGLKNIGAELESMSVGALDVHYLSKEKAGL